jgi:hypothetical protein
LLEQTFVATRPNGSIPPSGISPPNRQCAKPLNSAHSHRQGGADDSSYRHYCRDVVVPASAALYAMVMTMDAIIEFIAPALAFINDHFRIIFSVMSGLIVSAYVELK